MKVTMMGVIEDAMKIDVIDIMKVIMAISVAGLGRFYLGVSLATNWQGRIPHMRSKHPSLP